MDKEKTVYAIIEWDSGTCPTLVVAPTEKQLKARVAAILERNRGEWESDEEIPELPDGENSTAEEIAKYLEAVHDENTIPWVSFLTNYDIEVVT